MANGNVSKPFDANALGLIDRTARRVLFGRFDGLNKGRIRLREGESTTVFGKSDELTTVVHAKRPEFFRKAVLGGTLSVAESYIQGDWDCDDLTALFRIFLRNRASTEKLDSGLSRLAKFTHKAYHWAHANTRSGSRTNIAAHYDLGNDFFALWLDETLAYSSGIFRTPADSMKAASAEKFDRICRKLDLKPGDSLVEIGSGWGGFAMHAAERYGSRVTTTTISKEQAAVARERIVEAGLGHLVNLLQSDYRDLTGRYDKLVSIEMIEAVGYRYLDQYFRACSDLLKPDGTMVIQAIVMPEQGYAQYLKSVDFIQRFVFPGGCLPSIAAMAEAAGRTTDLRLVHLEDFAPHYAQTLRLWRQAFHERIEEVRALGYDEAFIRLWNYYLCYCEAGFEERAIGVVQAQFDKPECRRDPIRITDRAAEAGDEESIDAAAGLSDVSDSHRIRQSAGHP
jgi:cyclopropane-fatty-acyl-phospholipid synthase